MGLIQQIGRTRAKRYFIEPTFLRRMDFSGQTTLKRIESHRLRALVVEDLKRYPGSAIGEIHSRIGTEINRRRIKRTIDGLVKNEDIYYKGEKRGRRYWVSE